MSGCKRPRGVLRQVCEHGLLARQRYICELEKERNRYKVALEKVGKHEECRGECLEIAQAALAPETGSEK